VCSLKEFTATPEDGSKDPTYQAAVAKLEAADFRMQEQINLLQNEVAVAPMGALLLLTLMGCLSLHRGLGAAENWVSLDVAKEWKVAE
jgi:hypothetical protein